MTLKLRSPEDQNLDQQIDQLLSSLTGKEFFKGGFDRIRPLFSPYAKWIKDSNITVVTIAGTNGKGGTVHYLEQMFLNAGLKVASFSSPHIISVVERMKFAGESIRRKQLLNILEECRPEIEQYQLSYYETLFLVFLKFVKELSTLDYIILEVGLGGRLDAVNHIDHDVSVITSISRDHTEILGTDLVGILKEKYGISRKGKSLWTNIEQGMLRKKLKEWTEKDEVSWVDLFDRGQCSQEMPYEKRNYTLARAVFQRLTRGEVADIEDIPPSKGRGEVVTLGPLSFIFIGAHNVDGMRKMAQSASGQNKSFDVICLSFSKRSAEDVKQCLNILAKSPCLYSEVWVTSFDHFRSMESAELLEIFKEFLASNESNRKRFQFVEDYKSKLSEIKSPKKILVTGSYYFIGEFQHYLECSRTGVISV